ncbi:hypothetical protein BDW22DRAFT_1424185 [Trametopsis cervina]|nr:hypothetical protein BDW22DRAFT_1424185 [Trametopsis cervina]
MRGKYELLDSEDVETNTRSSTSEDSPERYHSQQQPDDAVIKLALYVACLCLILNACALLYLLEWRGNVTTIQLKTDLGQLEWRSTYIDFDVLYKDSATKGFTSSYRPITNHAQMTTIVSSAHPMQASSLKQNYKLFIEGNSTVNARRLYVTPSISTVAQFRVLDWGMENCTLEVALPGDSDEFTTITYVSPQAEVDVWLLDPTDELESARLSWSTKPARDKFLGTLAVGPGVNSSTSSFRCPTASYQTVEIACLNCTVDATHVGYSSSGFFLKQAQTA